MMVLEVKVILMILISCSLSEELNEEMRWTVVEGFVDPLIISSREERVRRSTIFDDDLSNENEILYVSIANWILKTMPNDCLIVSTSMEVQWMNSENLVKKNVFFHPSECDVRHGHVINDDDSIVVLTICANDFYVMLRINEGIFYVRPSDNGRHVLEQTRTLPVYEKTSNHQNSEDNVIGLKNKNFEKFPDHINLSSNFRTSNQLNESKKLLDFKKSDFGIKLTREKRDSREYIESYNLTGDIFELESETRSKNFEDLGETLKDKGKNLKRMEERDIVERLEIEEDTEKIGYFFDKTWDKTKLPKRTNFGRKLPSKWLEICIAIDYSVINFHGKRVEQYVLALFNIVSAIYKHSSLHSNLKLAIVRMILYTEKKDGKVQAGNSKKSLLNVNKWNSELLSTTDDNHDVAVWLTKLDIGGPSGYAPMSGVCNPAKSCTLNRDEGFSSAFIIAHEIGHTLGFTHDGDEAEGNNCGKEASMGSVMAPVVVATFNHFHWSSCSREELNRSVKKFKCLENEPGGKKLTYLDPAHLKTQFTMDQQCRTEFGEGYALCQSFEFSGLCSRLWCSHANTREVCKTKNNAPLEGTVCGENKLCINGNCEPIDGKRFRPSPMIKNAGDWGWSSWSPWGKCSRSCGLGVRLRSRHCKEAASVLGGKYCKGDSKDFMICKQSHCPVRVDLRRQQCLLLPNLVGFQETSSKFGMTWLPHEVDLDRLRCRLSCRAAQTNEIFISEENVTDGTPCYYGASDICIQGTCHQMGCDKILNSMKKIDSCGVCDGNDSTCKRFVKKTERKIHRGMTRVSIIPRASYNVSVEITIDQRLISGNFTFTIRDAGRRRNDLTIFDSLGNGQTVIVEGAAFRSRKFRNRYEIWARGPVLSEVVVSLGVAEAFVKRGFRLTAVSRYIVNSDESSKKSKYSWISYRWSPCSASCGGGKRRRNVVCKDDETGRIVNRKKCSLLTKPIKIEKCNNFSCKFKWIPGPWEVCSATCGNQGIQNRRIYCVHSSFVADFVTKNTEIIVNKITVSSYRCKTVRRPGQKRECNRSPCSVELRNCQGEGEKNTNCDDNCERDKRKYCVIPHLKRYCDNPGYRKLCCRSCRVS